MQYTDNFIHGTNIDKLLIHEHVTKYECDVR